MNDKLILGKVYVSNGENVLFITYMKGDVRVSEIVLLTADNQMELLVSDKNSDNKDKLNFHPEHQIEATYRLRKDCEKTIYFTDNYNVPRFFIINRAWDFVSGKKKGNAFKTYAVSNMFMLARMYDGLKAPQFHSVDVIEGGNLDSGSYNIAVQYLDGDYNPTEWMTTSNTIIIYKDSQDDDFTKIRGSNNNTLEHQNFGPTNKSIKVRVTNLDRNYVYVRIALIHATAGTGFVNKVLATREIMIPELDELNPPPYDIEYTLTKSSLITELTESEIQAFTTPVHRAKTIEQIDNILVLGNIKDRQVDWCKLQKYASKIQCIGIKKEIGLNNFTYSNSVLYDITPGSSSNLSGTGIHLHCYNENNWFSTLYWIDEEGKKHNIFYNDIAPFIRRTSKGWFWLSTDPKHPYHNIPDSPDIPIYQTQDIAWNNDYKRAVANLGIRGYMPGEVYSLGIVYVFEDGFNSPVFHIPCNPRPSPDISKGEFSIERALCDTSKYPKVRCEDRYWGDSFALDADNNYTKMEILDDKRIRHHKFPLRTSNEPLVKQKSGELSFIPRRKYHFYINFRRKAKSYVTGLDGNGGDNNTINITANNVLMNERLLNVVKYKKNFYQQDGDITTRYNIKSKGRPGDLSRGGLLGHTHFNRFKKNFETIELIIHLTWKYPVKDEYGNYVLNKDGEKVYQYLHEVIDHEVLATNELRPRGNKNINDTWGVRYDVPERDIDYHLTQVIVVEKPQVIYPDDTVLTDDEGDREMWMTTGSKYRYFRSCLGDPVVDRKRVKNANGSNKKEKEKNEYEPTYDYIPRHCVDYLRFFFNSPWEKMNSLSMAEQDMRQMKVLTNFKGYDSDSDSTEVAYATNDLIYAIKGTTCMYSLSEDYNKFNEEPNNKNNLMSNFRLSLCSHGFSKEVPYGKSISDNKLGEFNGFSEIITVPVTNGDKTFTCSLGKGTYGVEVNIGDENLMKEFPSKPGWAFIVKEFDYNTIIKVKFKNKEYDSTLADLRIDFWKDRFKDWAGNMDEIYYMQVSMKLFVSIDGIPTEVFTEKTAKVGEWDDHWIGSNNTLTSKPTVIVDFEGSNKLYTYNDFRTSSVCMSGRTRRVSRKLNEIPGGANKYMRHGHLISYINPLPVIHRIDYNDVRDTRQFSADIMGIQFSNIELPDINEYVIKDSTQTNPEHNKLGNRIIGYKIVRSPRDEENMTILDSGVLTPIIQESPEIAQSKYLSSSLMYPILANNTEGTSHLRKKINSNVMGLITPRTKFLNEKLYDNLDLIIEGYYGVESNFSPYIESCRESDLWKIEDVMEGSSYNPETDKRKEDDSDGWELQIYNKHLFVNFTPHEPTQITSKNTIVNLDALSFKDVVLPFNEIQGVQRIPLYNMSSDNRMTIISFRDKDVIHSDYRLDEKTWNPQEYDDWSIDASRNTTTVRFPKFPYVKLKRKVANPYSNFMYIPYYEEQSFVSRFPIGQDNPPPQVSAEIFNGDSYIVPMKYRNDLFYNNHAKKRKKKDGMWQMIVGGVMTIGGAVMTAYGIPGGTKLIGAGVSLANSGIKLNIAANIYAGMHDNGLANTLDDSWSIENFKYQNPSDDQIQWISECIDSFWFETNININWRNGFTGIYPDFENPLVGYSFNQTKQYLTEKLTESDLGRKAGRSYLGYAQAEIYELNRDYMRDNRQKLYFSLSQHHDCCSECKEQHPLRIAYSQQSFQEERTDNYMTFLPNNYNDIPGESGCITKIITMYNNLVVLTDEGIYNYPKNQQERITGQIVSFIGTGDYFSIPAKAIINDDSGRGSGCSSQWAVIKTPYGIIYPSVRETTVYLYDPPSTHKQAKGLRAISDAGTKLWFNENMRLNGNDDNPSHPLKNGFVACYDDVKSRYILTKKEPVIVNNQLEDDGWTLGCNLESSKEEPGMWISFYSYQPNMYITTPGKMMSWKVEYNKPNEPIKIWEHNIKGEYQEFYGVYYPYIVEYVGKSNQMETTLWDNIQIHTTAQEYIESYEPFENSSKSIHTRSFVERDFVTFNKAIFYNSTQCTNIKTLKVKDDFIKNPVTFLTDYVNSFDDNNIIVLDKKEKDWTLNKLRDEITKREFPMWIKGVPYIRSTILPKPDKFNGYVDKILNQNVFGIQQWYDRQPLRDKYLVQRYIFFDQTKKNVQLTINYSVDNKTVSYE